MQCPVCHNEVGTQSTFCNHCGAPLAAAIPPATPPPAAYTPTPGYSEVPPAYTAPPPSYGAPPPGYGAPPAGYPPAGGYPGPPAAAGSGGLSTTAAAAIAYITFIPAIIFLVVEPYNKTPLVRFHSMQSIALNVVWFAVWIALVILSMVLIFIPIIHLILFPIHLLIWLGFFIAWLMAIMKASKGEFYKLPIIGDFAMKQAQK
jgi:uncharacterized membrane protein